MTKSEHKKTDQKLVDVAETPQSSATVEAKKSAGAERSDRKTDDSPDFGVEGTNKTLCDPGPDATMTGEMAGTPTKYIPDSPYKTQTR